MPDRQTCFGWTLCFLLLQCVHLVNRGCLGFVYSVHNIDSLTLFLKCAAFVHVLLWFKHHCAAQLVLVLLLLMVWVHVTRLVRQVLPNMFS